MFVLGNSHHVVIGWAFGDTDILILAISVLYECKHRITIDKEEKECLVGYNRQKSIVWHYLEYMHSVEMAMYHLFLREAKKKCWKIIEKFQKFLTCFKTLGNSEEWIPDYWWLFSSKILWMNETFSEEIDKN